MRDVTSAWTCYAVWGPRAREVLAPLTPQSLDNADFPYMSMRQTTVGGAPARLLRVTFVGELGWEVYVPTEHGSTVWSLLADGVGGSRRAALRLQGHRLAARREGLSLLGE